MLRDATRLSNIRMVCHVLSYTQFRRVSIRDRSRRCVHSSTSISLVCVCYSKNCSPSLSDSPSLWFSIRSNAGRS